MCHILMCAVKAKGFQVITKQPMVGTIVHNKTNLFNITIELSHEVHATLVVTHTVFMLVTVPVIEKKSSTALLDEDSCMEW